MEPSQIEIMRNKKCKHLKTYRGAGIQMDTSDKTYKKVEYHMKKLMKKKQNKENSYPYCQGKSILFISCSSHQNVCKCLVIWFVQFKALVSQMQSYFSLSQATKGFDHGIECDLSGGYVICFHCVDKFCGSLETIFLPIDRLGASIKQGCENLWNRFVSKISHLQTNMRFA